MACITLPPKTAGVEGMYAFLYLRKIRNITGWLLAGIQKQCSAPDVQKEGGFYEC